MMLCFIKRYRVDMRYFIRGAVTSFSILCIVTMILKLAKNHAPDKEIRTSENDEDASSEDVNEVRLFNRVSCYMYVPIDLTAVGGKVSHKWWKRSPVELKARGCQKRLPRVLIIGVKEGGTTTLGKYLGLHPSISYSNPVQPGSRITNETMERWKRSFQLTSNEQMALTSHPALFTDLQPILLQMVRNYLPRGTKLILMLRDPVQRLVSDYAHTLGTAEWLKLRERKHYKEYEGLKDTLEASVLDQTGKVNPFSSMVRIGMYNIDLLTLYQHVPRERILIIDGNEFIKDPFPSLVDVERFLELQPFFKRHHFVYDAATRSHCANVSSRPDIGCVTPQMGIPLESVDNDLMIKLYEFFEPHNKELEEEFGVQFPWINRHQLYSR